MNMMSFLGLQDSLVKHISTWTKDYRLKDSEHPENLVPPSVYAGFLAYRMTGEVDPSAMPEYPSIVVHASAGNIRPHRSALRSSVKVNIYIGVWDDSLDMQGYRDVLNLVQNLSTNLFSNPVLDGAFALDTEHDEVFQWQLVPDKELHPHFFGIISSQWQMITPVPWFDGDKFLSDADYANPQFEP